MFQTNHGRLIAIGDIHGEITKLKDLIGALNLQVNDRIVFLGDYIDRGEDSKATLEYLFEFKRDHDCVFLRGNHEDMMLRAHSAGGADYAKLWFANGGAKTLQDFDGEVPILHRMWIAGFRTLVTRDDYYFVHAGLKPGLSAHDSEDDARLWDRPDFNTKWNWGKRVVCGHTIQHGGPLVTNRYICIDTGAFIEGHALTAVVLPEEHFIFSLTSGGLPVKTA